MTYIGPAWEFAADIFQDAASSKPVSSHHLNLSRNKQTRGLNVIHKFRWFYHKISTQQAEVVENHKNENIRSIRQGVAQHWKFKLGGG